MTAHDHRAFVEGCYRCELSRDEGGDGSPQLDLDAIRARLTERRHDLTLGPDGKMAWAVGDITALLALVRRLQQENALLTESLQCDAAVLERVSDERNAARGRVEELTEALRTLVTQPSQRGWDIARALLAKVDPAAVARVVPEKETP